MLFKIKDKNQDFVYVDNEFGYHIKEGYVLKEKEYKEIIPWEGVDDTDEDEIDPFTGIPVKDIPSFFATHKFKVVFDDDKIASIILFNRESLAAFYDKVIGTTFLFVPFTERYNENTCIRGEFLEGGFIKKYKTPLELKHDQILSMLYSMKEKITGKKVELSLYKPSSVEGYTTDIEKIGVISDIKIREEYGTICVYFYFDDNEVIDTYIYNDVKFAEKDNMYTLEWAGMTATDSLDIEIVE